MLISDTGVDTCQPSVPGICAAGTKCKPPASGLLDASACRLNLGLTGTAMYRPSAFPYGQTGTGGHRTRKSPL